MPRLGARLWPVTARVAFAGAMFAAGACELPSGGVCLAERYVNHGCEAHGGEGRLVRAFVDRPQMGRTRHTPASAAAASVTPLSWEVEPNGWSHARAVGDSVFLFSRNSGELAVHAKHPPIDAVATPLGDLSPRRVGQLERAWTDFDVAAGRDGQVYVVASDAFDGRLFVGRVDPQGGLHELRTWQHPQLRDLERARFVPTPSDDGSDEAGLRLELWSPFGTAGLEGPALATTLDAFAPTMVPHGTTERRYAKVDGEVYRASLFALARTEPELSDPDPDDPEAGFVPFVVIEPTVDKPGRDGRFVIWDHESSGLWSDLDLRAGPRGKLQYLFYDTINGRTQTGVFDPQSGERLDAVDGRLEGGFSEVSLAGSIGPRTWEVFGLSAEGRQVIEPMTLTVFANTLRDALRGKVPGYQLTVMQSGELLYRESFGYARWRTGADSAVHMTARDRMNVASISKLVTAVSVLREAERGRIDLDAAIRHGFGLGNERKTVQQLEGLTIRELLTHRAAFEVSDCERDAQGKSDCSEVLEAGRQSFRCNTEGDHICCPRIYQNANYQLLRERLEGLWRVDSTPEFAQASRDAWLSAIGLGEASCAPESGSAMTYYDATVPSVFTPVPAEQSGGCDSSGWHFSAVELARLMRALRYRWVLGEEMSAELEGCGETGWIAWDTPWPGLDVHTKNGRLSTENYRVDTVVARLPNNVDIVLLVNARGRVRADEAVRDAWYGG